MEFRSIDNDFEINLEGAVRNKHTWRTYFPKDGYIKITINNKKVYFNSNKCVYDVFKSEVINHYLDKGFKMVSDFAPFSDVLMVNNKGEVWNIKRGKQISVKRGDILRLEEQGKTIAIHKLVYMAFVGDPGNKDVKHKDKNKFNNNIDNLYIGE